MLTWIFSCHDSGSAITDKYHYYVNRWGSGVSVDSDHSSAYCICHETPCKTRYYAAKVVSKSSYLFWLKNTFMTWSVCLGNSTACTCISTFNLYMPTCIFSLVLRSSMTNMFRVYLNSFVSKYLPIQTKTLKTFVICFVEQRSVN